MACRTRPLAAALALMLSAIACSNPLSPSDTAGVYGWRGASDITLPSNEVVRVVADTLVLRRDRSGVRRTYSQRWSGGTLEPLVEMNETAFDYRIEGNAVGFDWLLDCAGEIMCAASLSRTWFDYRTSTLVSRDESEQVYVRGPTAPTS